MNLRESLGILFIIVVVIYGFGSNFSSKNVDANYLNNITVSNDMPFLALANNVEVYSDRTKNLALEELTSTFYSEQFARLSSENSGFGYTQDWVWYRIGLRNIELEKITLILEVRFPLLDHVEGYVVSQDTKKMTIVQRFDFGDRFVFDERVIKTPYFTQPIYFEEEYVTLYLKVNTKSPTMLPIYLGSYDAYIENATYRQWIMGIVYGIAIALVFYNIVLYLSLKDRVHLYYALFTLSLFMYFACVDGFAYRIWPTNVIWQEKAHIYIIYLTLIFSILFSRLFLGINEKITHAFRSTNGLIFIVTFSMLATPFLEQMHASIIMSLVVVFIITYELFLGISRMKDGAPMADFYVVIWGSLIVVTIFNVFASFSFLFPFEQMLSFMKAISVVQLILLSIGVGYKINAMRDKQIRAEQHARRFSQEARKAEKKALDAQIESNKQLENRVSERTLQLQEAMEELSHVNKKLTTLSEVDGLTGLYNRRKIESEYDRIVLEVIQRNKRIGFLFVDIDHFKRFNDTYGHDVGDECLRQVATMMKQFGEKYHLAIGRLGGEEFVLIDMYSDVSQLTRIAENFRDAVAKEKLIHNGRELAITVSVGGYIPSKDNQQNRSFVMREADDALYHAKEQGRNCVVIRQHTSPDAVRT
ncbi:hypothetical protein A9Q99_24765 [Gammaproteobacteria bacterium 45_16_T64]|nr:hypothetical protein A9Q99_24765 [Gammaproteobacteria bacterium 45_16_T64]